MIVLKDIIPIQIYFVNARSNDNSNVDIIITNVLFDWKENSTRTITVILDNFFTGKIKFKILYI